ncbi:hypothetical protein POJ06DRAFT_278546 [Lipomyces tetrasporus]|uniref:Uncharacterized protein n=1 Tax=Lipomyces tetrasporus TaxID=54092 RepID=A0AAD7QKP9_9ASCO|nr:uncharacterized protein POJ06DRAFT_278546 [Lipomyces tetrasporus]KAJ8097033.1 hypothetical protein POJ06DRAFT_278546 [Lipomyces tetrasporus]
MPYDAYLATSYEEDEEDGDAVIIMSIAYLGDLDVRRNQFYLIVRPIRSFPRKSLWQIFTRFG